MRNRIWRIALSLLVLAFGASGCRKYPTHPIYRLPVITSVVAYPTVLSPGDSTMITINATDPDGDLLLYSWMAYNGLIVRGSQQSTYQSSTENSSAIFYRSPSWPGTADTAFVWCSVWDARGGVSRRQVILFYRD